VVVLCRKSPFYNRYPTGVIIFDFILNKLLFFTAYPRFVILYKKIDRKNAKFTDGGTITITDGGTILKSESKISLLI